MSLQPMETNDYSGGFTDNYVAGARNKYQRGDNLLVNVSKSVFSRFGSVIYDATNYQIPTGAVRIGTLLPYKTPYYSPAKSDLLLSHSSARLYYVTGGTWTNLIGPVTNNQAFPGCDDTNVLTHGEWEKHLLVTSDLASPSTTSYPVKIFRDSAGVLQLRTAGLPDVSAPANYVSATVLANAITLANSIKTVFLAHIDDYAGAYAVNKTHSSQDTISRALFSAVANASDLPTLITLTNALAKGYTQHVNDARFCLTIPASYAHIGSGNDVLNEAAVQSQSVPTGPHIMLTGSLGDNITTTSTSLSAVTAPQDLPASATLAQVCARLDNLRDCYNWHDASFGAHWHRLLHTVATAKIGYVDSGPRLVANITDVCTIANAAKSYINTHKVDAGGGAQAHARDDYRAVTSADATDYYSLFLLYADIACVYAGHSQDGAGNTHTYVGIGRQEHIATGTAGEYTYAQAFSYPADPYDIAAIQTKLFEIRTALYLHAPDIAVLHRRLAAGYISPLVPTIVSWAYALHYKYSYTVGSATFEDDGPVTYLGPIQTVLTTQNGSSLSVISPLANGSTGNWDTSALTLEVYRTVNAGTQYHFLTSLANATTSYADTALDVSIADATSIYTTGGVVENDPPPQCKCLHIVDGKAYYGNIVEAGVVIPTRVRESLAGDPDSAPARFFADLPDEVIAISSAKSKVIALCKSSLFRIEGGFDELGRGQIIYESIHDTIGCVGPQSVVQAEHGVFFAGTDGFYFTDAFQLIKINEDWPTTYASITSTATKKRNIQGVFRPEERRVYWTVQTADGSGENDALVVLDLRWGIRPDSTFTTWSNSTSFRPTAVASFGNQLIRGDSRGYWFKHDPTYLSDPKVAVGTNPSTWATKAIIYDLITCAYDFGFKGAKKYIPGIDVYLKNHGNVSLQMKRINNDKGTGAAQALGKIRFRSEYTGTIEEERTMPAGYLRSTLTQIQFTNASVIITNSDTHGQATTNQGLHTLTLDSAVTEDWPLDPIDWTVAFPNKSNGVIDVADAYATKYVITARSADTLTVTDAGATLPAGSEKWILEGVPKDEQFELTAHTIWYDMVDGSLEHPYQSARTGANT